MADRRDSLTPFEDAGDDLTKGMEDGLRALVDAIMAQALIEVPKDTGVLERSAFTTEIEDKPGIGFDIEFGFGFGDEINPKTHRLASDYAVPVHEIMEAQHEPPTKAKFLEDPVLEFAAVAQEMIAVKMKSLSYYRLEATGRQPIRGLRPGEKLDTGPGLQMVKDARGRFVRKYTP